MAVSPLANSQTLWQLRSFCRGEMSAAESYTTALLHDALAAHSQLLRDCQASHAMRARLLQRRIGQLGGKPPQSSGAWGAFVDALEEAAADLGATPAILVLQQGEEHGLRDYHADLGMVDPDTRNLIQREIIPAQIETRRRIRALGRSLRSAS